MPNPQDIFQLAQQSATQVTASPENWRRFLYTAAHNYHTTYLNQLLIHAQRPDATACATMKYWNEQAHRKVMYGSKSIIILQRHQGVPTAKRVFSMTDTVLTGDKAAAPWEVTDVIRPLLMQVNSVGSLMDRATEQVVSLSDRANRVLATSIEDSALNWSHPEDQRFILQEVAAQSTLYMICIRLGIPVREEDFPAFQNVTQFDTSRISLCLGGYVQAAAEPLLDELGHEVMQLARDSVAIQAEPVHNTDTQSPTQTTSREEAVTNVNAMAQAIENAIVALKYKGANYTKVDAAIDKANALKKEDYKDFSGVEAAVNAVVRDKNITDQSEVDAMAQAIEDAIAALQYKDADYTKVDAAIAKANALNKDNYKDFSAVETAVNAVARGKNITEQGEVDAMAKAIEDALAALQYKDADKTTPAPAATATPAPAATATPAPAATATPAPAATATPQYTIPQTGDTSNPALLVVLMLVSGSAAIGTAVVGSKKKHNR